MSRLEIEHQARLLAVDNRKAEPDIEQIFWFPADHEVRLVEVLPSVPKADQGIVQPFYFSANPAHDLPAPTGIAMVRPEEVGQLKLPEAWGDWNNAIELEDKE